jgi:bifunctional DNA-binding transcriptional regulator/antitoxin component of YhaV-PrlF toxin-antitoxin module
MQFQCREVRGTRPGLARTLPSGRPRTRRRTRPPRLRASRFCTPRTPGPPRALPLTRLHRLPRETSMLHGIGRVDSSGRVADREIIEALHWRPGDRLEIVLMPSAIVIRACPDGPPPVPQRPSIVIPRPARTLHRIEAGDHVLLAAAPAYDVVIVHTLSALDDMLASYHSTSATGIPRT